jgi:hypothetical protein
VGSARFNFSIRELLLSPHFNGLSPPSVNEAQLVPTNKLSTFIVKVFGEL